MVRVADFVAFDRVLDFDAVSSSLSEDVRCERVFVRDPPDSVGVSVAVKSSLKDCVRVPGDADFVFVAVLSSEVDCVNVTEGDGVRDIDSVRCGRDRVSDAVSSAEKLPDSVVVLVSRNVTDVVRVCFDTVRVSLRVSSSEKERVPTLRLTVHERDMVASFVMRLMVSDREMLAV
jgi:hypothetical protein